jgi:hypothetical protein
MKGRYTKRGFKLPTPTAEDVAVATLHAKTIASGLMPNVPVADAMAALRQAMNYLSAAHDALRDKALAGEAPLDGDAYFIELTVPDHAPKLDMAKVRATMGDDWVASMSKLAPSVCYVYVRPKAANAA